MFRLLLAVASILAGSAAIAAERVTALLKDDGIIEFQIHESRPGRYALEVLEVNSGKQALLVENFDKGRNIPVLVSQGKSTLKEGVYKLRLLLDNELVFEAAPPDPEWDGVFDTASGKFERRDSQVIWNPARPCLARVMIMSKSGAILHLLKDWHFSNSGKQVISWDYKDIDKRWNFSGFPALRVLAQQLVLPAGWLVIGEPDWSELRDTPAFATISPKIPDLPLDFECRFRSPEREEAVVPEESKKETPIHLDGAVLMTVLEPSAVRSLSGQRFEILLYLDGEFFHEESQGVNPYNYSFPPIPKSLSTSFLTVNVLDYRGNIATRTFPIETGKKP